MTLQIVVGEVECSERVARCKSSPRTGVEEVFHGWVEAAAFLC